MSQVFSLQFCFFATNILSTVAVWFPSYNMPGFFSHNVSLETSVGCFVLTGSDQAGGSFVTARQLQGQDFWISRQVWNQLLQSIRWNMIFLDINLLLNLFFIVCPTCSPGVARPRSPGSGRWAATTLGVRLVNRIVQNTKIPQLVTWWNFRPRALTKLAGKT